MNRANDKCQIWWTDPAHAIPPGGHRRERRALERARCRALMDHVGPLDGRPMSVTHSHGRAGLVVGPPGSRVGIDLELEADRDCASLAELAYGPEESRWLLRLERMERRRRFHELWTLKEAFAKALSLDLVTALAQCRFTAGADGLQAQVPTNEAWTAAVCSPFPGYRLAVVSIGAGPKRPATLHFVGAPGQLNPKARDFVSVKPRMRTRIAGSVQLARGVESQ